MTFPIPIITLPPLGTDDDNSALDTHVDITLPDTVQVELVRQGIPFVDRGSSQSDRNVQTWDEYVGQDSVKRELQLAIAAANMKDEPLPHILLASGLPGAGKTELARLVAAIMGGQFKAMAPPFDRQTLTEAVLGMDDWGILFIDEIHLMRKNGLDEDLLTVMEEGWIFHGGEAVQLAEFTVIGATTDKGLLRPAVLSRFEHKPMFEPYNTAQMVKIVRRFCRMYDCMLQPATMVAIAKASRKQPRFTRQIVNRASNMQMVWGRDVTGDEVLSEMRLEPDGTGPEHVAYLTMLRQYFPKKFYLGTGVDRVEKLKYVAGEDTMKNGLLVTKQELAEIERWLIQNGLMNRTTAGRELTDEGVRRAEEFIRRGMGVAVSA